MFNLFTQASSSPARKGREKQQKPKIHRYRRVALEPLENRTLLTVNLLNNYTGLNQGSAAGPNSNAGLVTIFSPPDTCGAAGTTSYVETSNQGIRIFPNKTSSAGAITDSANDFWFTQGGLAQVLPVDDPKPIGKLDNLSDITCIWDDQVQRFIIADQDVNFTTHASRFEIAVSRSATPATLTAADWFFYQVNTTEANHDADYPGNLGYNRDALVFTLNQFGVGGAADRVQVTSISINDLVAGNPITPFQNDITSSTLRPTVMHDSAPGDPMWLIAEDGANSINVIRMTNVLSNAAAFATTPLPVNAYSQPVPALQPDGTAITPPSGSDGSTDGRIQKAAEFNNSIVACQAISVSGTEDDARWYRIDVSGANPVIADQGNVSAGNNTYIVYPAIDINSKGDIGMTYSQSGTGTGQFMAAYVTGRSAGDAAGTMQTPVLVQAGAANNTDGREGDLSGISVDSTPLTETAAANQSAVEGTLKSFNLGSFTDFFGDFWGAAEWGATGGSWGTAIGQFSLGKGPWSVDVDWGDLSSHTTFAATTTGSLGTQGHTYVEEGPYTVTVKVTNTADNRADTKTFSVNVSDPAVIPIAVPVAAVEGADTGTVPVATFTDPGGAEPLADYSATIDWGDGTPATGGIITFSAGTFTVQGNHTYGEESAADHPGSNPYDITVTISHDVAPNATVHSSATVSDPAVIATGGFAFTAVEGVPSAVQTVATFTDPGGAEALIDYSALIDWGDGTAPSAGTITIAAGTYTVQGSHTYAVGLGLPDDFGNTFCDGTPPTYHKPITVTVSHELAPTAQAVSDAAISIAPGTAHLAGGSLIVVATTADDHVVINPVGNTGAVRVQLNFLKDLGSFSLGAGGRIIVAGLAGNDNIQVAGGVTLPTVLYGGPGNDRLNGGNGPNILVGCDGDDQLLGGNAHDLLIGGDGADRINGNAGDDTLIAANLLNAITLAEDTKFSDLVAALNGGPIVADDDGAVDVLTGAAGVDTFFYNYLGSSPFDIVTDKAELAFDV